MIMSYLPSTTRNLINKWRMNEISNIHLDSETRRSSQAVYSPAVAHVSYIRRWQSGKDDGNYSTSREVRTCCIPAQVNTDCEWIVFWKMSCPCLYCLANSYASVKANDSITRHSFKPIIVASHILMSRKNIRMNEFAVKHSTFLLNVSPSGPVICPAVDKLPSSEE